MNRSLLFKLFAAYLVPVMGMVAMLLSFGLVTLGGQLDEEVGKRLSDYAAAAATTQRVAFLSELAPGDDGNRTHHNAISRLLALKGASALVERVYVFDRNQRLVASSDPEDGVIGTPLSRVGRDQAELEQSMETRRPVASNFTFEGYDGRLYKSGYAPLLDGDGQVWGFVGVDASAESFRHLRRSYMRMTLGILLVALLGMLGFGLVGDRLLLRPIRRLRRAARRIQRGDLNREIALPSRDEMGQLAENMDQMREKLLSRQREMQMMLSGIAHEVRNPLGGIALFAGILSEELTGESEKDKRECVERIQRELGHLERLVDDFLNYARDPKINKAPIDVPRLFGDLAEILSPRLSEKRQKLEVRVAPEFSPKAEGEERTTPLADEAMLHRALLNLLINASQAAPEGGHLAMEATTHRGQTRFTVSDDGPGIPSEAFSQLLTPFYTTKEKGIGLGLSLVSRFATSHGGDLKLLPSEKGATFQISVPTAASNPRSATGTASGGDEGERGTPVPCSQGKDATRRAAAGTPSSEVPAAAETPAAVSSPKDGMPHV